MASTSSGPDIITYITYCILLPGSVLLVAATRQNVLVRLATLLGFILVALHACQQYGGPPTIDHSPGGFVGSYGFKLWFGCFLGTGCFEAWWFLFYANLEDIRYKDDKIPVMHRPLLSRIYWLWSLWLSPRGVGWSIESANIPPKPGPSRTQFLARRVMQLFHRLVLSEIAYVYRYTNPVFGLRGDPYSLGGQGPIFRCLNALAFGANAYCATIIPHLVLSIIAVASGFSEPCDWPNIFGNWSDAYTVRRFWDRAWHQWLRKVASSSGKFTARHLGFTRGSWLSSCTQLLVGFSVTGLIHVFIDWMLGEKGGSFLFFILQAFGITFEDAVVGITKKIYPNIRETRWTRVVGYLWTIAWLSWSVVLYADWLAQTRATQSQPASLPIVAPAMRLVGIDVYDVQHLYPPVDPSTSSWPFFPTSSSLT